MPEKNTFQRFKPNEIALSFPETADTLLLDIYLTDDEAAKKVWVSYVRRDLLPRINGFELHRSDVEEAARGLPPQARQQPADKLYAALLEPQRAAYEAAERDRPAAGTRPGDALPRTRLRRSKKSRR